MRVTKRRLRREIRRNLHEAKEARLLSETLAALSQIESDAEGAKESLMVGADKGEQAIQSSGFLSVIEGFFGSIGIIDPCKYVEENSDELMSEKENLEAAVEEMRNAKDASNANAALSGLTSVMGVLGAGSLGYFMLSNWGNFAQKADVSTGGHVSRLSMNIAKFVKGVAESDETMTDMQLLTEFTPQPPPEHNRWVAHNTRKGGSKALHTLGQAARGITFQRAEAERRAAQYKRTYPNAPQWKLNIMSRPDFVQGRGVPNVAYATDNPLDPMMHAKKVHPVFQDQNISPEVAKMAMDLVRRQLKPDENMKMKLVNQMKTSRIGKWLSGGQERKSAGGDAHDIHPHQSGGGWDSAPTEALKHKDNQQFYALTSKFGDEGTRALKLAIEAGVDEAGQNKFNYDQLQHHDKQTPDQMRSLAKSQLTMTLGKKWNPEVLGQDAKAVAHREPTAGEVAAWKIRNRTTREPEPHELRTRQLDPEGAPVDADGDGVPDRVTSGHAETVTLDADRDPDDKSPSEHDKRYGLPRAASKTQRERDINTIVWKNQQWESVGYTLLAVAGVLFVYRLLLNLAPGVICTIKEFLVTVASKIGQGLKWFYNTVILGFVDLIKDLASRAWSNIKSFFSDEDERPRLPVTESYGIIKEWNNLNDAAFVFSSRSLGIL